MEKSKRVLTGRVNKRQKAKLLELMRASVGPGPVNKTEAQKRIKIVWKDAAKELNNCGVGVIKSAEQWKKCWTDWKASVKKQYISRQNFEQNAMKVPEEYVPRPVEGLDKEMIAFFTTQSKPLQAVEQTSKSDGGGFVEVHVKQEFDTDEEYLYEDPCFATIDEPSTAMEFPAEVNSFDYALEAAPFEENPCEASDISVTTELENAIEFPALTTPLHSKEAQRHQPYTSSIVEPVTQNPIALPEETANLKSALNIKQQLSVEYKCEKPGSSKIADSPNSAKQQHQGKGPTFQRALEMVQAEYTQRQNRVESLLESIVQQQKKLYQLLDERLPKN